MSNIQKNIEQLEEVGEQLDKGTTTAARLALLLLDNLIELIIYEKIRMIFYQDSVWKSKIPPSIRNDVMRDFKNKVTFLVSSTNEIDPDDGEVLKVGHTIRNQTYHSDVLRESIIISITKVYFETVCRLWPRLWWGGFSSRNYDYFKALSCKYEIKESAFNSKFLSEICNCLIKNRTCPMEDLQETLASDVLTRLDDMLDSLDYLAKGSLVKKSTEETLKWLQFYENLKHKKEENPKYSPGLKRFHEKLFPAFVPGVTLSNGKRKQ